MISVYPFLFAANSRYLSRQWWAPAAVRSAGASLGDRKRASSGAWAGVILRPGADEFRTRREQDRISWLGAVDRSLEISTGRDDDGGGLARGASHQTGKERGNTRPARGAHEVLRLSWKALAGR